MEPVRDLVAHHVAVTSTLPVFETLVPNRPRLEQRVLDAMLPEARVDYLARRARIGSSANSLWPTLFKKEMEFERAFVKAGGLRPGRGLDKSSEICTIRLAFSIEPNAEEQWRTC